MTDEIPISCSLGVGDLEQRLAAIARIGAESLISRHDDDERHLLRFRAGAETRRRLEEIVAAEAKCCSFLEMTLSEESDALVLTIVAPPEADAVAAGLSRAFAGAA